MSYGFSSIFFHGYIFFYLKKYNSLEGVKISAELQGVPKKMLHSEIRLWGTFRYCFSLTMISGTLIIDTRASLGDTGNVFVSYNVTYRAYKSFKCGPYQ